LSIETGLEEAPVALAVMGELGVKEFIRMEFAGIKFN